MKSRLHGDRGQGPSPPPLALGKQSSGVTATAQNCDCADVISARIRKLEDQLERALKGEVAAGGAAVKLPDPRSPLSLHNPRMEPRSSASETSLIKTAHVSNKAGQLWDDLQSVGMEDVSLLGAIEDACQKCDVFLDSDMGPASTAHSLRDGRTFRHGGVECREFSVQTMETSVLAGADSAGETAAAFSAATTVLRALLAGSKATGRTGAEVSPSNKASFHARLRALAPEARDALLGLVEAACSAEALLRDDVCTEDQEAARLGILASRSSWQWQSPSMGVDDSVLILETRLSETDGWAADALLKLHEDSAVSFASLAAEMPRCKTASPLVGRVPALPPARVQDAVLEDHRTRRVPVPDFVRQPCSPIAATLLGCKEVGSGSLGWAIEAKAREVAELQARVVDANGGAHASSPETRLGLSAARDELRLLREFAGADETVAGVDSGYHAPTPPAGSAATAVCTESRATRR